MCSSAVQCQCVLWLCLCQVVLSAELRISSNGAYSQSNHHMSQLHMSSQGQIREREKEKEGEREKGKRRKKQRLPFPFVSHHLFSSLMIVTSPVLSPELTVTTSTDSSTPSPFFPLPFHIFFFLCLSLGATDCDVYILQSIRTPDRDQGINYKS